MTGRCRARLCMDASVQSSCTTLCAIIICAPNFSRLGDGARGQFLAGDADGKAEIVFDFGAGAGLTAGSGGFDQQHVQPFGSGVNGGGQARRSRADDDQIAHLGFINAAVESEALGQFPNRGIAQTRRGCCRYHREFRPGVTWKRSSSSCEVLSVSRST